MSDNTVSQITAADYRRVPRDLHRRVFWLRKPLTQRWQWSEINDGKLWPALNFVSAEGFPDDITALVCTNLEIWAFGKDTVEVFYHTNDLTYPFQRFPSAVIPIGTSAPWSIATISGVIFWIGSSANGYGSVWMSQGTGFRNGYLTTRRSISSKTT